MSESSESSVEKRSSSMQNFDELMVMQASDNPGMVLVTAPLNDSNFLTWSRSVKRALAAKNKLGFVTGSVAEPSDETERCKWRRVDEMVTSWIINSMSKDIAETFVYCSLARKLWMELEEQYGESNGPQIYQVQRQIASIEQGNQWEELNVLQPIPSCSCGAMKECDCDVTGKFSGIVAQNKLVQFLMGLNECYDAIRSQILVLDPLPTVSKAYSMVLRIEKQKAVQNDLAGNAEASVLAVRTTQYANTK